MSANTISDLLRMLESHDVGARERATIQLGKTRPVVMVAVPILIRFLEDDYSSIRWAAARTLGTMGKQEPEVVAALFEAFCGHNYHVNDEVWEALKKTGEASFPVLEDALLSKDDRVRFASVNALSNLRSSGGDHAGRLLIHATSDAASRVREEAMKGLCDYLFSDGLDSEKLLNSEELLPALMQVASDPSDSTRANAVACLGLIEPRTKKIRRVLKMALKDNALEVREAAERALGINPFKVSFYGHVRNFVTEILDSVFPGRAARRIADIEKNLEDAHAQIREGFAKMNIRFDPLTGHRIVDIDGNRSRVGYAIKQGVARKHVRWYGAAGVLDRSAHSCLYTKR